MNKANKISTGIYIGILTTCGAMGIGSVVLGGKLIGVVVESLLELANDLSKIK